MKRIPALLLIAALCLGLTGCQKKSKYEGVPNPVATIAMEDGSVMRVELYVQEAPNTVANFVSLANAGFYDGMDFYRVVPGCLIQTGDPTGDGTGGPGYSIKGEFAENGVKNTISHVRGVISMARQSDYDTAGSQFFILQGSYPEYDGYYAAFGKLMDEESLQTLDAIANVRVDAHYSPVKQSVISTIRVDTMGYEYKPTTIKED
jgi:peptidyl-prolyl cis-trans isomerase B (cyclophilin B)